MNRNVWGTLLWIFATSAFLRADATLVRTYQLREPHDRRVLFAMAVTPQQDILSFVPKRDGIWRLTRVRDWLDDKPIEQTIAIQEFAVPARRSKSTPWLLFVSLRLLVTNDGMFAVAIASGRWRDQSGYATDEEDVVSVIDLRDFRVVKTIRDPKLRSEAARAPSSPEGTIRTREYALDRIGHLVVRTRTALRIPVSYCDLAGKPVKVSTNQFDWGRSEFDLEFLTLPSLTSDGAGRYTETQTCRESVRDDPDQQCARLIQRMDGDLTSLGDLLGIFSNPPRLATDAPGKRRCPLTGSTRDALFEKESCFGFPTRTLWGNLGKPKEWRENIFSVKTGQQVGTVDELVNDSVRSEFADHNGRDYLVVVEGGTRLKIYHITN